MASLNDYNWHESKRRRPGRRFGGIWLQAALSLVLVIAVAGLIGNEGVPGVAARYLAGPALNAESSWFSFGRGEAAVPATAQLPPAGGAADSAPTLAPIKFVAPASGVVVKGMALDAAGLTTDQGIIIQGVAGQSVKAAAAGEVLYMGESESGFIVELGHAGGFSSVYQGLSELGLSAGQQVSAGETLGVTESGELLFALFLDDKEVDPLVYLFQQQV